MARQALLLSHTDDPHVLAVQKRLQDTHHVTTHVVETDNQVMRGSLAWTSDGAGGLRARDGDWIDLDRLGVVWNRRTRQPQRLDGAEFAEEEQAFLTTGWRDALISLLLSRDGVVWVNDPAAVEPAERKLHQLTVAAQLGLRTPRTFIGQDLERLRDFLDSLGGDRVTVKKLRGTRGFQTEAIDARSADVLAAPHAVRVCPAIYQDIIEGREHLRVHVLGEEVISVKIVSDRFDWRTDPSIPLAAVDTPADIAEDARSLTSALGLRMAIIDVKLTESGAPVWLEVNQQGQFLFAQGATGTDLVGAMARMLAQLAGQG